MNMNDAKRRLFLKSTAVQGAALGLAGAGMWAPQAAFAQNLELRSANLFPSFTVLLTDYISAKGLDKKHGFTLAKSTPYSSVSTFYNDFVAGNYEVCMGTWDTFAARYLAGVPLQLVCSITSADMINILTPAGGVTTLKGLEGKTLAAPQSTGTYRLARAILKEMNGIDIERTTKIQNVDNPAASVTLVMANRADAGLSWEPSVSAGLHRAPDMRVLFNAGEEYRKKVGQDLPFFGVAIRKEVVARDPGIAAKVDRAFADCIAGILGNVDEAVNLVGAKSGIPLEVMKAAISSGRLQFKHSSMADEKGRKALMTGADFLVRNGMLPRSLDSGFFAA
jgi:NitT/TauT family transport system substrate-binding protein